MADNTGEATVDETVVPENPERREFLKNLPVLGIAWGAFAASIGVVLAVAALASNCVAPSNLR